MNFRMYYLSLNLEGMLYYLTSYSVPEDHFLF